MCAGRAVGAGVLRSSEEVYLGMPARFSICYDIKTTTTTTCNGPKNRHVEAKAGPTCKRSKSKALSVCGGRAVVQECCGAHERCIRVCLHHPATATTSTRPPQPRCNASPEPTREAQESTLIFVKKCSKVCECVWWSCGCAGVLRSS